MFFQFLVSGSRSPVVSSDEKTLTFQPCIIMNSGSMGMVKPLSPIWTPHSLKMQHSTSVTPTIVESHIYMSVPKVSRLP